MRTLTYGLRGHKFEKIDTPSVTFTDHCVVEYSMQNNKYIEFSAHPNMLHICFQELMATRAISKRSHGWMPKVYPLLRS